MNLPAFCIRRPAFTIVISLVMIIIGVIGFMNLSVRWIPNVSSPQVTITTAYPGASARMVEHDVTKVIEGVLSGINGVETLTSTSRQGESQISMTFKLGRNMDAAVEDVRSNIERARGLLPKDVENPIVMKADPNSMPILFLSFYGAQGSDRELSDYIDKYVVPSFETIDGVGSVGVYGKRVSAMRIWLDPAKMASANVTVDEVTQLLRDENASIPSGKIRAADRFYSVVTDATLKTPEQFNDLIVRQDQEHPIRLKDIGEVKWDPEDVDSAFRVNGKRAVALGIIPQSTANPLEVEHNVQKVLADLKRTLPAGMKVQVDYNIADYIRSSMDSVYEAFFEAVLFVWLVIFIFLGNFRATLIPILTIPVCVISTFAILYFFGFSINTITLMALVLAIGLVVDDAIVMLENIERHMQAGLSAFLAAIKGSKEIVLPIIAMTLTLTAVYAPIAFTPGLLGVLFREFTFTLAGAVLVSGIVALTLSPMMCARILKVSHTPTRYHAWFLARIAHLQDRYRWALVYLLQKRKWVVGLLLCLGLVGFGLYKSLPSELAPAEDTGDINAYVSAPRGASFQYSDGYIKQLEAIYANDPDVESYFSVVGMNSSPSHTWQLIKLKPKNKRKASTAEVAVRLNLEASRLSGVRAHIAIPPPPLAEFAGGDEGDNVGLVLMTNADFRRLQQVSQLLVNELRKNPNFVRVENNLKWDSEQFQVNIDRNRASDLKISIPNIANTVSTLLAGRKIGKTEDANVMVQMQEASLADPNIFQQLYVRNRDGNVVSLSQVLSVQAVTSPEVFRHAERLRSDIIRISLSPQFKMSEAVNAMQTIAKENLPPDMKFTFSGEAKSFLDATGKTAFTFVLALVFIYLVLVAQFESFIDPLIILLTVPFAVVGAILTLKLFHGTFNIYSNIGLITLIGLIAKHGILITEFANRLRMEGKSIHDAVVEASLLRLRPILMTTAAMVLGALPLAFAFGAGAESRQQIGLVITGGLLFGTFFSLVVVPIAYTYLAPFRKIKLASTNQEGEYATIL